MLRVRPKALAIVVSYAVHPGPLIESVSASGIPLRWHIHHHGPDASFAAKLQALAHSLPNASFFDHRVNRGLSRSWNESLSTLSKNKNEVGFIFNDDLHFKPGGFSRFFEFVSEAQAQSGQDPRYYSVHGDEVGVGALCEVCPQGMACCAINAAMYRRIGPFDENFAPAYYEDCDYFYRMKLLGYESTDDPRSLCIHERNKSSRTDSGLLEALPSMLERNKRYYIRKWGGEPHEEAYISPFNISASPGLRSDPHEG